MGNEDFCIVNPDEFKERLKESLRRLGSQQASDPTVITDAVMDILQTMKYEECEKTETDILAGRDPKNSKWPGTVAAKQLIEGHVAAYDDMYRAGAHNAKGTKIREILEEFHQQNRRFLKQIWVPMNEEEQRKKVGHFLRDSKKSTRGKSPAKNAAANTKVHGPNYVPPPSIKDMMEATKPLPAGVSRSTRIGSAPVAAQMPQEHPRVSPRPSRAVGAAPVQQDMDLNSMISAGQASFSHPHQGQYSSQPADFAHVMDQQTVSSANMSIGTDISPIGEPGHAPIRKRQPPQAVDSQFTLGSAMSAITTDTFGASIDPGMMTGNEFNQKLSLDPSTSVGSRPSLRNQKQHSLESMGMDHQSGRSLSSFTWASDQVNDDPNNPRNNTEAV